MTIERVEECPAAVVSTQGDERITVQWAQIELGVVTGRDDYENAVLVAKPVDHASPRRHDGVERHCGVADGEVDDGDLGCGGCRTGWTGLEEVSESSPHQIGNEDVNRELFESLLGFGRRYENGANHDGAW
jgi:hypothetical protein